MNRNAWRNSLSAPILHRRQNEDAQNYGDNRVPTFQGAAFRRTPVGSGSAIAAFAFMLIGGTVVMATGLAGIGHPIAARASAGDNVSLDFLTRKTDGPLTQVIRAGIVSGDVDVVVRFAQGTGAKRTSKAIALAGGHIYHRLDFRSAVAARVPRKSLARLAALPCVAHLSSDAVVSRTVDLTTEHNDLVFPLSDATIGE